MDKMLLFGFLRIVEKWEVIEIAAWYDLSEASVLKILQLLDLSGVLPKEPEVDLTEMMPGIFNDG